MADGSAFFQENIIYQGSTLSTGRFYYPVSTGVGRRYRNGWVLTWVGTGMDMEIRLTLS